VTRLEECLSDCLLIDKNLNAKKYLKVGVVGPCSSGKTTLIRGLKSRGYSPRHIAQEHSYVPDMWKRISSPDILIYLDVSYSVSMARRPLNLTEAEFEGQIKRLSHARKEANIYLHTDNMSIDEVLTTVLDHLDTMPSIKK
jgi:GTPase SAR1 family protein